MQEIDPWPTSYWGGVVFQEKPRDFALGKTIGESYSDGRTKIPKKSQENCLQTFCES